MRRLPEPAQYLLRIDDLCPTIDRQRWSRIRDHIRAFRIRPILAVIPDNQDHSLQRSPLDEHFWEEMREMQSGGATIALHGYQHWCRSRGASLVPLHRRSEFAGQPLKEQCSQIRAGLALLRDQGLSPRLFVAPNHGFDQNTLIALREVGLPYLSDGFARIPFVRDGVTWIPQQLWLPVSRRRGLWTICVHSNSTGPRRNSELGHFLKRHGDQFTSFDEVLERFRPEQLGVAERLYERLAMWRVLLHLKRKRIWR